MPRRYINKMTVEGYTVHDLQQAVSDVRNHNRTYRQASEHYNIPVGVIFNRIKQTMPDKKKGGGCPTSLNAEVEEQIVECLKDRARMGYPCNKEELCDLVAIYVKEKQLKTAFKDGRPRIDWYYDFMKRHPVLSFKKPKHSQNREKFSENQKSFTVFRNNWKKSLRKGR
ncbi:homeobox-like domain superfamily [Holotrichia oblita]|uniref:Homeobox-like domain superfamily n=1 Tax=Holotrichia oblita TaxID=644536 RepID=A0ACB9SZG3_HOLOL|nr:homeobox-like domain superfamily [Holotrichia oblita]